MEKGQIVAWMSSKSYGFIRREGFTPAQERDHFFHQAYVKSKFSVGDYVEFDFAPAAVLGKPPMCVNVRVIRGLADLAGTEAAQ
jgi:cold shock CspA family protein